MRFSSVFLATVMAATVPTATRVGRPAGQTQEPDWSRSRAGTDNTARSAAVHDMARLGIDPGKLLQRLNQETDVPARRAIVIALGGYAPDHIAPAVRAEAIGLLRRWHESDSDPGIHAAVAWLSARWNAPLSESARPLSSERDWFVTVEGQPIASLTAMSVTMGSPAGAPRPAVDSPPEPLHDVRIDRRFAIGMTEITR